MISSEAEARDWVQSRFNVSRETMDKLEAFETFLVEENQRQNLISRHTFPVFWLRHIADCAQLLLHAEDGPWLDLGSGAGFPGLVVAVLSERSVTLVESRRLRVDFLHRAAALLGVEKRTVILGASVERLGPQDVGDQRVISARAFAPLGKLFDLAHPFSTEKTRLILPKGRSAASELEAVRTTWQGSFRIEPSLTDAEAGIIVADGICPNRRGKVS